MSFPKANVSKAISYYFTLPVSWVCLALCWPKFPPNAPSKAQLGLVESLLVLFFAEIYEHRL